MFCLRNLFVPSVCVCLLLSGLLPAVSAESPDIKVNTGTIQPAESGVNFTASPDEGYPPLCVQFTVTGPEGEYSWDFGDGATSPVRDPVHCYTRMGSYWVKLRYLVDGTEGEVVRQDCVKVGDPEMNVDFSADPVKGPAPLTSRFTVTGKPTETIWHFGDGSADSDELNPVHQFREPGNFTVTLTYCAPGVCDKVSKVNYIEAESGNLIDFSADKVNETAPVCTGFTATGDAETYRWDFGDGVVLYEKDPVHCYANPGLYSVSLTYSIEGIPYTVTKDRYLRYTSRDAPAFTYAPVTGTAPLCVDYSIVNPSQSWEFHFGDNSSGTGAETTHCYSSNGSFTPSLTYCSNGLCENTVSGSSPIIVRQPQVLAEPGAISGEYRFSTDAPEGLLYHWDFGDGSGAEGAAATHRYLTQGTFNVTLAVDGICGCNAVTKKVITAEPKENLSFSATPLSGCAPHCVQFHEVASEEPVSRLWDFGDGEVSTEMNPFHCYQFSGTYSVTLTDRFRDHEETKTMPDYISVSVIPDASFTAYPQEGVAPLTVTLSDTSEGVSKRSWDFGDGSYNSGSQDKSVEHRFDEPGDYNVTLTVWGGGDCNSKSSQVIHVGQKEDSPYDFSGLPRRGAAPLCTSFKLTGDMQQSELDLGDGNKTNERNPFSCYASPGVYSPALHACDTDTGCSDIRKAGYIVVVPPDYLNVRLFPGWNLVSVPLTLEKGQDTLEIFSGVNTGGHTIFSWDSARGGWKRAERSDPVDPLSAFWIYTPDQATVPLQVSQDGPVKNLTRSLNAGWNLVSINTVGPVPADEAFRSVEGSWSYAQEFDAEKQRYSAPVTKIAGNTSPPVDPCKGYWLFMNSTGQFIGNAL